MRSPDALFTLIRSLSKTEKRYFKRYTLIYGKGDSNYLDLFNAIERQETHNEAEIKKQFRGRVFLKQFPVTKNYLFHLILKSMELYHQNHSVEVQTRSLLNRANFLFERSMYKECEKVLNKAKQKVEKYELHGFLLEILRLQKKITSKKGDIETRLRINDEESLMLLHMKNTQDLLSLRDRIFSQFVHAGIGEQQRTPMDNYLKDPLLRNEKEAKTFLARYYFWDSQLLCHAGLAREQKVYECGKNIVDLYSGHPPLAEYHITNYLAVLYNFHFTCDGAGRMKEMKRGTDLFIEAKQYVKNENDRVSYYYHQSIVLHYYNITGDFDKAILYGRDNIFAHWELYKDKGDPIWNFELVTYIATGYFGKGDHHNALKWLNKNYHELKMEHYADLVLFGYMFYFIVHVELKNFDLLPSLLQSMKRYSQKNDKANEFHGIIFGFFRKISEMDPSSGKLKDMCVAVKKEIDRLSRNTIEFEFRKWFDYMSWIDSKIENRSFAEIISEKARG